MQAGKATKSEWLGASDDGPAAATGTPGKSTLVGDSLGESPDLATYQSLSGMNMAAILKRLDKLGATEVARLDQNLKDNSAGSWRLRAAMHAVEQKLGGGAAASLEGDLGKSLVSVAERADVAEYLGSGAGGLRKRTLDDLATVIDAGIQKLSYVEQLSPGTPPGQGALDADREKILARVHDYLRIVDAELAILTGADLKARTEQKARFDHFKVMREEEKLGKQLLTDATKADYEKDNARKKELDKQLLTPGFARSAVGTTGHQGADAFVVYEDYVKVGGSNAWICNNPGNMEQSPLATFQKVKMTIKGGEYHFAIFPTMEAGFDAIPLQLVQWQRDRPGSTLLDTCKSWAPTKADDPAAYAQGLAHGMNERGVVPAGGGKVTPQTLLQQLKLDDLKKLASAMMKVEGMEKGDIYRRSDSALPAWVAKHLGPPAPASK